MVAEAAVDFNSTIAQSNLQQSRIANRRANLPRSEVFDFKTRRRVPYARTPETGNKIKTPNASSMPPTTANNDLLFKKRRNEQIQQNRDYAFKEQMHRKKIQDRIRIQKYQIPEVNSMLMNAPKKQIAEAQPIMNDYSRKMTKFDEQDRKLAFRDTKRSSINQAKEKLKDEVKKQIAEKAKKYVKKYGKDMAWRIFGRGGVVEVEGTLSWSWFGTGVLTSMYQAGKFAVGKKDMLPGMLNWLEPNSLDVKNPLTWGLDIPYAIVGYLILILLIGVIHIVLIIIIVIAMSSISIIDSLDPLSSIIGSLF